MILVQWQTTDSSNSVRVRVRFPKFFTFLSFYLLTSDLTGQIPADLWPSLLLQLCSLVRVNQEGHHTSGAGLVSETRDNGVGCHWTETTCVTGGDRVMCRHEVFKTRVSPQGSIQDLCLSPGFYSRLVSLPRVLFKTRVSPQGSIGHCM